MDIISRALAVLLLSSAFSLLTQAASAQSSAVPPATASRPSTPDQTSIPANAPPATTTQTTGQVNPDPKIREMNAKEKDKVEREGK